MLDSGFLVSCHQWINPVKVHEMRLRTMGVVVALFLGLSSFARSASFDLAAMNALYVTQFRDSHTFVTGSRSIPGTNVDFFARIFDDVDGSPQGFVSVTIFNFTEGRFSQIGCNGSAYAASVALNRGTGTSTVHDTLDPASPGCSSFQVDTPITLNLSGQSNDNFTAIQSTVFRQTVSGAKFNGKSELQQFSQTINGTIGPFEGPFTGFARHERNLTIQRVK